MNAVFYLSAVVAIIATIMTITRLNAMHALLYMVVSLFAVAVVFYVLGAPFAAVLEIIIYAGAIMVLFVFVIMMLMLGKEAAVEERSWLKPQIWIGPSILAAALLAELAYMLTLNSTVTARTGVIVDTKPVASLLFGPYLLAVEIASMLLLAGLVAAYRIGRGLESRREKAAAETAHAGAGSRPAVRT